MAPRQLCVIGDPVLHSKSPLLHNTMLSLLGLDFTYSAVPVSPAQLPAFVDRARGGELAGFNATMPHKEALVPYLDGIDPLAEKLGAVNTVCIQEGKLYGFNTDCPGLAAALEGADCSPRGRRAVVLGAGGAGRAAALGLVHGGAAAVAAVNRTRSKAEEAAALAPGVITAHPLDRTALAPLLAQADILVNATNLGMAGSSPWPDLDFLEDLSPHALVFDLIYHPAETALLARAKALGHPVMNGLPLLIHQAILALERFTGTPIPPGTVLPALHRALAEGH